MKRKIMNKDEIIRLSNRGEREFFIREPLTRKLSACTILEKSKKRIIGGIVSTDSVDTEKDRVTKIALDKMWSHIQSLPEKHRNLMLGHTSAQVGTILMEYGEYKSGLTEEGLYLVAELRDDIEIANKTWDAILGGDIHGFSIKFQVPSPEVNARLTCDKEQCWTELFDGSFIEVSLTDNPANKDCNNIDIISKAIDNG